MSAPSITLTPKTVRKAVVTQLIARSVAGGNVYGPRGRPFQDAEIPAGGSVVQVFSSGSSGNSRSPKHLPRFAHSDRINIVGATKLGTTGSPEFEARDESLADAVDDLESAIFEALLTNRAFAKLEWGDYRVAKGFATDQAGHFYGEVRIELEFVWEHKRVVTSEPSADDEDLESVDVKFDVDGDGVHGPNADESTGPDDEPRTLIDGLDVL